MFFFLADYGWKVVKVRSRDQRTQSSYHHILTENDKSLILYALVGEGNQTCLKHFLLSSNNTAVANLKPHNAEFMPDGNLRLTLETQKRNTKLFQPNDVVETCVNQCLQANNCRVLLLSKEKGYKNNDIHF